MAKCSDVLVLRPGELQERLFTEPLRNASTSSGLATTRPMRDGEEPGRMHCAKRMERAG
jgi:hypothetical protein